MPQLNMAESLNLALDQCMDADDTVCVMGEDVGVNGGVFRVTKGLLEKYGEESWELDALDPRVITELIEQHVEEHTDEDARDALIKKQESDRERLQEISDKWKD